MKKYITSIAMVLILASCNKTKEEVSEIKKTQTCTKHYYTLVYVAGGGDRWEEYYSHPVQNGEGSTNGKKISIDGLKYYEIKCR